MSDGDPMQDGNDVDWSSTEPVDQDDAQDDDVDLSKDWSLDVLVRYADLGVGFGVTVVTGGGTISGQVTSERGFMLANRDNVGAGEGNEGLRDALASAFETFGAAAEAKKVPPDGPPPVYRFLHLSNGKIFAPGQRPMPATGMPMRIALEDVIAWSFGELS